MSLHPLVGTLLLGSAYGQDVVNYCQANYCQPELKNVGCNPPSPAGGPACLGKFTHSADLASANGYGKQIILSQHNKLRSLFASGKLAGFQPAIRMPTLVWDEELARQAGHNVRSCVYAHDECRNTPLFHYVGQNIAKTISSGTSLQIDQLILESVQAWW
uniref:Uncharacterized protein n=1 Tax=Anopheles atroparvus TaxID=41427 RepID=A0A182JMQ0_ANOAO